MYHVYVRVEGQLRRRSAVWSFYIANGLYCMLAALMLCRSSFCTLAICCWWWFVIDIMYAVVVSCGAAFLSNSCPTNRSECRRASLAIHTTYNMTNPPTRRVGRFCFGDLLTTTGACVFGEFIFFFGGGRLLRNWFLSKHVIQDHFFGREV